MVASERLRLNKNSHLDSDERIYFDIFDADKDGFLTKKEFGSGYLSLIFEKLDLNRDGKISRVEYSAGFALLGGDDEVRGRLDASALDACFDLEHALRHCDEIVDRALALRGQHRGA